MDETSSDMVTDMVTLVRLDTRPLQVVAPRASPGRPYPSAGDSALGALPLARLSARVLGKTAAKAMNLEPRT